MNRAEQVSQHLFADDGARVFAVLDGATIPDLLPKLHEHGPDHECLYRGELAPDLAECAPYLVRLDPATPFAAWVLEQGWGKNWGVFVTTRADLRDLRSHFRTFLFVHDEEGRALYFRFYDPRVLRVYLPTCNAGEAAKVFGSIMHYTLEGEQPGVVLRFREEAGVVRQEKLLLA